MDKLAALQKYFGYGEFRPGQERIIDSLLLGRDALCVMPTGAGKSICYQIPALLGRGVTLVVSPLISLMKDQVNALCQLGIPAAYINSSLTPSQYRAVAERACRGQYKILYIAPERLLTNGFLDVCGRLEIDLVAVDEAHCVSQWGQDFRPSYLKIAGFIERLSRRPVVGAFTATATGRVREDIAAILRLRDPLELTTGFDRANLYFGVEKPQNRMQALIGYLKNHENSAGIVYCATRKAVEDVCASVCRHGFSATRYHAGLPDEERKQNQEDFLYDRKPVMVATNAFGMGIDKSNVAFVIHYNMPKNIESYYQEAGRAGRDGSPAECILLYNGSDVRTNLFLIDRSEPNPELTEDQQAAVHEKDRQRLRQMTFYAATADCLRAFILNYFGERPADYCGRCSNCKNGFESVDVTVEAQKILSCVARTGSRYGVKMIVDILRGSKNERLLRLGLHRQSTYGLLADSPQRRVRAVIDFLVTRGYAAVTDGEYPTLTLTPLSKELLFGRAAAVMKVPVVREKAEKPAGDADIDGGLLTRLKELRSLLAKEERVPAYIIFSDAALADMCRKLPADGEEFLRVSGVGEIKRAKYGERFLAVIREHASPQGD